MKYRKSNQGGKLSFDKIKFSDSAALGDDLNANMCVSWNYKKERGLKIYLKLFLQTLNVEQLYD